MAVAAMPAATRVTAAGPTQRNVDRIRTVPSCARFSRVQRLRRRSSTRPHGVVRALTAGREKAEPAARERHVPGGDLRDDVTVLSAQSTVADSHLGPVGMILF